MKLLGVVYLIFFTTNFIPFVVTKTNMTAANNLLNTGLLYCSPFECEEDLDCSYCQDLMDLGMSLCTPFGEFEDFCLFCRTDTPLHTCPWGFCACGLSMFNTEWCDPDDQLDPDYCDDEYCVDLDECGSCNIKKQSEKLHQAESKLAKNEEKQVFQQILKALEQ